jgi:glycosyltransferase involved in cell wall biosynthesis
MHRVLFLSHVYIDPANRGKLRALAARGLEVTVAVPQRWPEHVLGRTIETGWERQGGVEVFPVPVGGSRDPATVRFGRRELASLVRDKRPDLIQIEEEPTSIAARQAVRLATRLAIPPLLFSANNMERRPPLFTRWRRRRLLRRLKGLVAGSTTTAELVRREVPDLPLAVIPQLGVPVPPAPEHQPHEGLQVGYVGRLVREKGVDTLLQALALNRDASWHLTVVGDGPDRERLEALASALRLAARIRWLGALPRGPLARIWSELDVLVLPSTKAEGWNEPHGHVLAEAMAHEVAVVGADTGVIPELIGDAGVIVPAADSRALALELRRLGAAATRLPLAQAGRARALRLFSDDAVAERTMEFWSQLV